MVESAPSAMEAKNPVTMRSFMVGDYLVVACDFRALVLSFKFKFCDSIVWRKAVHSVHAVAIGMDHQQSAIV